MEKVIQVQVETINWLALSVVVLMEKNWLHPLWLEPEDSSHYESVVIQRIKRYDHDEGKDPLEEEREEGAAKTKQETINQVY